MKVGDYVRTEDGIRKVIQIDNATTSKIRCYTLDKFYNECKICSTNYIYDEDIIKSSPNIIDLIEENDFINGLRVEKNKYGELYTSYVYYGGDIGKQCEVYTTWLKEYKENEDYIVSILTKEQFESMEYKVKE